MGVRNFFYADKAYHACQDRASDRKACGMHSPRKPFTLAEHARIVGGSLHTQHGPNCASRSGGDCGCLVVYKLQRERKVRVR